MIKVLYALEKTILDEYIQAKQDIHAAKRGMSAKEVIEAKEEILTSANVNDLPRDFDFKKDILFTETSEGVARINITGLLTNSVSPCAAFFGESVTTYSYITEATNQAESNKSIHTIEYFVNSGGGYTDGLDLASQVIASAKKKTRALVSGLSASAAYYLASQTDQILALSPSDYFGSIGVACEIIDVSKADEKDGIKRYQLASTDAPNKRPDYSTEEGRNNVVKMLDEMHEIFVQRVIEGRTKALNEPVSEKTVNKEFGQGGMLIAKDALAAGMIDGLAFDASVPIITENKTQSTNKISEPAPAGDNKSEVNMSLQALLSEHPEAKAEYDEKIIAGEAEIKTRVEAAKPFLNPESNYGNAIKTKAMKVVTGEASIEALHDMAAMFDELSEKKNSDGAQAESKEIGDTKAEQHSVGSDSEKIETREDEAALIAKLREA